MENSNSYLSLCSLLSLGSLDNNVLPHDSSEELVKLLMSCFDHAVTASLFTSFNTCNFEQLTRTLLSSLKCGKCAHKVAVGLLNRGRLEHILETNETIWRFYCQVQVLTTTSATEQLFVSFALSVVCLVWEMHGDTEVIKLSDILLLSVEMFSAIGQFLASLLNEAPQSPKTPRRALVGHVTSNKMKFDVVIERDNTGKDSNKGTWSTPGFRLLFTRERDTIAYILTELVLSSDIEWSLRGMHVNSAMRGQGFSRVALLVWLLLSKKVHIYDVALFAHYSYFNHLLYRWAP